jgi:hypothetical protein
MEEAGCLEVLVTIWHITRAISQKTAMFIIEAYHLQQRLCDSIKKGQWLTDYN